MALPIYVAGEDQHPSGGAVGYRHVTEIGRLAPRTLAAWLARAAIYALPARYEPCGLSVLEAGLAGCALVLGDIPSLRETRQGAALFVPAHDAAALTGTLNNLSQDPAHMADLAGRARSRALQFTSERMLTAHLQAYQKVLHSTLAYFMSPSS